MSIEPFILIYYLDKLTYYLYWFCAHVDVWCLDSSLHNTTTFIESHIPIWETHPYEWQINQWGCMCIVLEIREIWTTTNWGTQKCSLFTWCNMESFGHPSVWSQVKNFPSITSSTLYWSLHTPSTTIQNLPWLSVSSPINLTSMTVKICLRSLMKSKLRMLTILTIEWMAV